MSAFRGDKPCFVPGTIGLRIMAICRYIWPRLARAMGGILGILVRRSFLGGSDQKIVDAVRDLLEFEEVKPRKNGDKRTILCRVDGVKIRVVYRIRENEPYDMTAYPVSGKWVTRNE
ncbi:MAG: hypothetical protein DI558_05195 [Corynebacterium propinquum]|uniref:hypothetical protein n=1 Tax=Corynebacterium TaxID=1716 RepID=UPI000DB7090D|nr:MULTISPECIES: hypothetical protein [Corynebacterium]MDK4320074.1 hypothetical protein [Corynebacterium propinquum]PZQ26157.1 MAG: hypothetical protein DI558_05195 [Corynebacterium propinquum]WKS30247.1 hypothetical protein NLL29_01340 [Corynebacterium pseudodiphtheriticum]WKS51481.1 hypothetical protein NLL37_00240 [Corynebacterium pseudodiphtheriticum]